MGRPRMLVKPTSFLRKKTGQMFKLFNLWEREKNPSKWQRDILNQPTAPPIPKEGKPVFLTKTQGLNSRYVTRRQIVLNRHFTEIISDVLVHNLKTPLNEMGVNITSIESKAWNKGVSVFYSTNNPFNEALHKKLNTFVGALRAAVTERQLIGRTPPINFVYDEVAQIEMALENSLKLANIQKVEPTTELVGQVQSKKVLAKAQSFEGDSQLNVRNFSAPPDMVNTALGMDYESMYNKVAAKLQRGRGLSERMPSCRSIASMGPVIKLPDDETVDEDPVARIKAMQKFMVHQRKKKEHLARVRRKQELLHRDHIKWDLPEDDGSDDHPLEDDFDEKTDRLQ